MNKLFTWCSIAVVWAVAGCHNGGAEKSASGGAGSSCGQLSANEICVKLGTAEPQTGGIAHLGKDIENGVILAIQDINAKGDLVIGGKKVKLALAAEDDAGDPKQGSIVAQKLVDAGVVGVVGHFNSGVSIPANAIYARAGLVEVSPGSTNPDYTLKSVKTPKGHVSAYRVVATDAKLGLVLAQYMLALGGKNVAILDDATQYGKGLADQVEKTMKKGGAAIVSRDAATDKTADFKAVLTEIKGKNPDYVFWGGLDDTGAILAKQMRELGIPAKLVAGDASCTAKFIELAGAAGEGMICSQAGMPLSEMAKGAAFEAAYKKAFPGQKIQIYAPFAYDATYAIVQAMRIAHSTDREAITAAMAKVNFNGLIGKIAFDRFGDIEGGAISIFKIKDKKLDVIKVVR